MFENLRDRLAVNTKPPRRLPLAQAITMTGQPYSYTNEPMNSASFLNRHRRARVRFTPKAGDPWMPVTSTGMTEESFDRLTGIR